MRSFPSFRLVLVGVVLATAAGGTLTGRAQQSRTTPAAGDWPMYRRDAAATGHSPLAQITPKNVATLAAVWTFKIDAAPPAAGASISTAPSAPPAANSQVTPIVVGGVMYLPATNRVVALEAHAGNEILERAGHG